MNVGNLTTLRPELFFEEAKKHRIIVDLRDKKQHFAGNIPGAINFPQRKVASFFNDLTKSLPIFLYCTDGKRSGRVARLLKQKGFVIYKLRGGYQAWKKYY